MPVHTSPPDCTPHPCERRRQRRYNDDESGSDRIAEAVADMDVDIVVNVQGDEPFVQKDPLEKLLAVFQGETKNALTAVVSVVAVIGVLLLFINLVLIIK